MIDRSHSNLRGDHRAKKYRGRLPDVPQSVDSERAPLTFRRGPTGDVAHPDGE